MAYAGVALSADLGARIKAGEADCLVRSFAGQFADSPSAEVCFAVATFRRCPQRAATYLLTFVTDVPAARLLTHVGATTLPPGAVVRQGTTNNVVVAAAPDSSGLVYVYLTFRGRLPGFTVGAFELKLID